MNVGGLTSVLEPAGEQAIMPSRRFYTLTALLCGAVGLAFGAAALAGWIWQVSPLTDFLNVGITQKANAGLCMVLTSLALLLLLPRRPVVIVRVAGRFFAIAAGLIGLLTLSQHIVGWDLGIDQILAREPAGQAATASPGRMGPPASTSYTLLGISLLLLNRVTRRQYLLAQILAMAVSVIALLGIAGKLYGIEKLYALAQYTGISLQTSIGLFLLSIGVLCARPGVGIMAVASSPEAGGILVRRMLVPVIVLPLALGWLRVYGEKSQWFDAGLGVAMFALLVVIIFAAWVLWVGAAMNRISAARNQQHVRLATLCEIQDFIARADTMNDIYTLAINALQRALRTDRASVLLFEADGVMRFKAWRGLSDAYRAQVEGHSPWKPDEPNAQPVTIEDVNARDDLGHLKDVVLGEGIHALAFIPLIANHKLIGKFMLYYNKPHEFSKDELKLAQTIGGHVAVALQRRADEQAIRRSERMYRGIGESINYGVWACDPDGRNIYASQSFLDLVGITQQQCSDFGWGALLHPDDANDTIEAWKQCAAAGDFWEREHRFKGKDNQWHHVLARGVPIKDDDGKILCWAGINLDISSLKQAQEELNRHKVQLEGIVLERTKALEKSHEALRLTERLAAMGTLVAGLGHDMGNLLLPVRARLDTLQAEEIPLRAREDVVGIRACIDHLQRLASGLRLFALDPEVESRGTTNLAAWRAEVQPFMRTALPREVILDWELHDSLPDLALAPHLLTQAVYNLVKNAGDAIQASAAQERDKAIVRIAAQVLPGDKKLRVQVQDNGPGMSDEVRRRCLEPFFTTKRRALSTGLGLSLVHGVVQRCGGSLEIQSTLGQGTTVSLALPVANEVTAPSIRRKALVAIKSPRSLGLVRAVLHGLEFEPVAPDQVHNGEAARVGVGLFEWADDAPAIIHEFLSDNNGRRAIVINVPGNGGRPHFDDPRIIPLIGKTTLDGLREALKGAATHNGSNHGAASHVPRMRRDPVTH